MKTKLTEKVITDAKIPASGRLYIWDSQLNGFGAVVGKRGASFVMQLRVSGRQTKRTIGTAGKPREDGASWNVARARARARELLVEAEHPVVAACEITLRQGIAEHIESLKLRNKSPKTIETLEGELSRVMEDWLDRPIIEITGPALRDIWKHIQTEAAKKPPRQGSVNKPGLATANRVIAQVSAVWNTVDRMYDLPSKNPASRVTRAKLMPNRKRIEADGFKAWLAIVETCSPVRRDMQLLTLFTAIRSEGVRNLRWDDIDRESRVLTVRKVKGGRVYRVPINETMIAILDRRKTGNAIEFNDFGGDDGWVFPSLSARKPHKVIHVAEPRESRFDDVLEQKVSVLPGLHTLRRTHNSVGIECGILQEYREMLLNHNGKGVNWEHYGLPQNWAFFGECQDKITAKLLEYLGRESV